MITPTLIELSTISKLYGFGNATTLALNDISLRIKKGEFVAIMGPSGCGKTTLLNIIGLLDRPSQGIYLLEQRDVSRVRSRKLTRTRRDHIGFIFQSFHVLPQLSVIENVALPLAYKNISRTKRLKRAEEMLDLVGLAEKAFYAPKTLSGGQLQRVAIARAFINNPGIIIADEPTGNLDSRSSKVVMELLAELHKKGNTIVMVTHNPDLTRYATRVLYMQDGAIVYDEETPLGQIPTRAKNGGLLEVVKDEDEQIASVSVYLQEMPDNTARAPRKSIRKSTRIQPRKMNKKGKA